MEVDGFIISLRCALMWKLVCQLIVYSIHLLLMIPPRSLNTFYVKVKLVFVFVSAVEKT